MQQKHNNIRNAEAHSLDDRWKFFRYILIHIYILGVIRFFIHKLGVKNCFMNSLFP